MNIQITGGCGFVGARLPRTLPALGLHGDTSCEQVVRDDERENPQAVTCRCRTDRA